MQDFSNGPAPGFWRMWWNTGGAIPAVLALFACVLAVWSFANLRDGLVFDRFGVVVEAEVADRRTKRVRRNDRWQTDHYVTLRFRAEDQVIAHERRVSSGFYEDAAPGTMRQVRYVPDAPRKVEFVIGETWRDGQKMRWVSLAAGLGTLVAIWWTAGKAVDGIRARRFGRAGTARVRTLERRKSKNSTSYFLTFYDAAGTPGKTLSSSRKSRYDAYPAGTEIEVFYGAKGRMWWAGDVGPRAAASTVPDV
ncbi:MAG: DUF3592 domain-containing protein [Pseudomonadota bacterium]